MTDVQARLPTIDMLKGCAILWVLLIHSGALYGRPVAVYLFNHAVPIFIVLFGVNSELWWRRRPAASVGTWYRDRARRLLVPMYAALPLWWVLALTLRRPLLVPLAWYLPLLHLAGDLFRIGTGWFITLSIQLVLLFPLLRFAVRRFGGGPVLGVGLVVTLLLTAALPALYDRWGPFHAMAFAPRFSAHVVFGMLLAPHVGRLGGRAALVSLAALAPCIAVQEVPSGGTVPFFADRLMELPLTVALLVAMRPLARVPPLAHGLAWLGQNSYGLYIGQMLAHDGFTFWFGLLGLYHLWNPWLYALALLASALALRAAAEGALRLVGRWRGARLAMAAAAD